MRRIAQALWDVFQCVPTCSNVFQFVLVYKAVRIAVCCSVLQCVAVRGSVSCSEWLLQCMLICKLACLELLPSAALIHGVAFVGVVYDGL